MNPILKFKQYLLIIFFSGLCFSSFAQTIKGTVADKANGDPLLGATVSLKNSAGIKRYTNVGLDGSFQFKDIPAGRYEVEAKYVSYKDESKDVDLKTGEVVNVQLQLQNKSKDLSEVTVKGSADKSSDQSARNVMQRSDQVLNAVSSRTIEVSPDITVANVMQRVSGVSIERSNNGEAQYPIIRGMEKRYISTLVNGIKIPSPDNKNRYIPLDIFPTDIIDRLEVYKSLTPSMEADAIAGSVNLVFKDAPDDFTVKANLALGYSQSLAHGFTEFDHSQSSLRSPRINNGPNYVAGMGDFANNPQHFTTLKSPVSTVFGLSLGGRSADKKFGAIGAFSYQDNYRNTSSVFFDTQVDPATNNPKVQGISRRDYSTEQQRIAAVSKFDYKFNNSHKITLNASYINLTQNQYRFSSDTNDLSRSAHGLGNGTVKQDPRAIRNVQQIYNFNLQGDHKLAKDFSINWSAVYSKATANENRSELALITGKPIVSGVAVQQPTTIDGSAGQTRTFGYNSDQDKSGYLNLVYTPKIFNTKVEFTAGGMYRNKTRNSTYDQYSLPLPVGSSTQTYNGNIDNNNFVVQTIQGTPTDALNYDFTENVGAAFGQFKFNVDKLQVLGGVRYENTDQSWVSALPNTQAGKTGSIKYDDLLPSLSLKYALKDNQNLRLSYYSAISRPGFYELIPHTGGDPDADYQEVGNPHLKHVTADNYDLRYEFFPKALDQLLVGVFYKRIDNPIEYTIEKSSPAAADYALKADNFGIGHNYGFELDFTKYISKFGIRANYTYTDSKITTTKLEDYRDAGGFLTNRIVNQSRPLQGQSKNIGNLSLLYKDGKSGLDAQISAVYTGERINTVSAYLNNDVWQKGAVTLDFSAEKRIFKNLYASAKVTNLLNTPYQLEIKQPYPPTGKDYQYQTVGQNTFVRKDNYQQYYLIGLRYKL